MLVVNNFTDIYFPPFNENANEYHVNNQIDVENIFYRKVKFINIQDIDDKLLVDLTCLSRNNL